MSRKVSKNNKKDFLDKMQRINPSIEIISEFYSYKVKVTCSCKVDGYIWGASPSMLLSGKGCPKCGGQLGLNAVEMNTLLTLRGFNVVSLENGYISRSKKSRFKCLSCGDEWNDVFNFIINRFEYGCKKCKDMSILQKYGVNSEYASLIKTTGDYKDALADVGSTLFPINDFKSFGSSILHICKKHNLRANISPVRALSGGGCKKCGYEKLAQLFSDTRDEYIEKLHEVNDSIELVGEYVSSHTKTLHRCKTCGHEWPAVPALLLYKNGCPRCVFSYGESKISDYLDSHEIEYSSQHTFPECTDVGLLRFDFYLPEHNTLIEYQGQQHYNPVRFGGISEDVANKNYSENARRDQIKREYAIDKNIALVEIPYWEYGNIDSILSKVIQDAS